MESLELFISSICNLNCKYCYIPKTKAMASIQKKIWNILEVIDSVEGKERIRYLGFWGAEPTLSTDLIIQAINKAKNVFPNLREISFSTNGTNLESLKKIVKHILSLGYNLEIQFSIDGPEYINGVNRQPGILDTVIENMKSLIQYANDLDFNATLKIRIKPTLTIDNMRYLLENDLIKDAVEFFRSMSIDIKQMIEKGNINFLPSYYYTLEVPGRYTKDDGLIFAEFLRELHEVIPSTYTFRFIRLMNFPISLRTRVAMFTCSGGDSNFGLDHNRCLHICHRSFLLNEEMYLNEILSMPEYKNWDVSLLRRDSINLLNRRYIVDLAKEEGVKRMIHATRCYHDFWKQKLASTTALIKELAIAEEISRIYQNDDIGLLLALFLNTAFSCPMENVLNTSSINIIPTSLIRLWGNGAFRELLKDVLQRTK